MISTEGGSSLLGPALTWVLKLRLLIMGGGLVSCPRGSISQSVLHLTTSAVPRDALWKKGKSLVWEILC